MTNSDHDRFAQDGAAYLLGALPPLEAEIFERHLMRCEECQGELQRLRPAAEALPRSVQEFEPPPSLKASLMEVVEREAAASRSEADRAPAPAVPAASREPAAPRERRAWATRWLDGLRPQVAAGLASIALIAGVAVGLGLATAGDDTRTVSATVDTTRLPASAAQVQVEGDSATLRVSGLPLPHGGEVYEVWIERDGEVKPAGALFAPSRDGHAAAAIPGGVEGVDRVMVTRERAGGVTQPTETPVIVADV